MKILYYTLAAALFFSFQVGAQDLESPVDWSNTVEDNQQIEQTIGLETPLDLDGIRMKGWRNPTSGDLRMVVSSDLKITEIMMKNAFGRVAYSDRGERFIRNGESVYLNVQDIEPGVYQLILVTLQGVVSETVIKE
ncbi:MAG: T9SS type A sorting domain-containing protein [Flavobacteriales bacterium]|nr:T9SS type A sorting domain-containing protein [Flavobacteriales bacterium]